MLGPLAAGQTTATPAHTAAWQAACSPPKAVPPGVERLTPSHRPGPSPPPWIWPSSHWIAPVGVPLTRGWSLTLKCAVANAWSWCTPPPPVRAPCGRSASSTVSSSNAQLSERHTIALPEACRKEAASPESRSQIAPPLGRQECCSRTRALLERSSTGSKQVSSAPELLRARSGSGPDASRATQARKRGGTNTL